MTPTARLVLAAPLALALSACGETTDVDDVIVEPAGIATPADVTLPKVDGEYPEVPIDARTTVDYAGDYELRGADDKVSRITLRADDTYTWSAADGTRIDGVFAWAPDGDRILIERDGEVQAYAVAENVLYRLPSATAPANGERSEETTWRRSGSPDTDDTADADASDEAPAAPRESRPRENSPAAGL
ncbi:hypothetical protein [Pelagerythrobacter sp.]|uniref:hypothetical protein n=1 Tax=Pelagerythrobacter sp. TaxID=2800702 RepID=UPI0035B1947A